MEEQLTEEEPLRRKCCAMEVHQRLLEEDNNFRINQQEIETTTARRFTMRGAVAARTTPYIIHVVVHVVHNLIEPAQNISLAQIRSQIKVLNKDFRATNPDKNLVPPVWRGLVADTKVKFVLKKVIRKITTQLSFGSDDGVKRTISGGSDAISPDKFLNLWVCKLRGGLLGYAQFPGGPSATDGVVVNFKAFGTIGTAQAPFNLGRTATHEVGHFLNLRHIWGDTEDCSGSDFVADTPNAVGPNIGTPIFPKVSCSNGPNGDMFMNYMDYVDDKAMFMFTTQQVERMHATLDGVRASLVTT